MEIMRKPMRSEWDFHFWEAVKARAGPENFWVLLSHLPLSDCEEWDIFACFLDLKMEDEWNGSRNVSLPWKGSERSHCLRSPNYCLKIIPTSSPGHVFVFARANKVECPLLNKGACLPIYCVCFWKHSVSCKQNTTQCCWQWNQICSAASQMSQCNGAAFVSRTPGAESHVFLEMSQCSFSRFGGIYTFPHYCLN